MVIKTDSLGNEEWTKYYGNPYVDDDMALVTMADDGNYLITTVYGEWVVSPTSRTGRIFLLKVDNQGNTIWQKKIGPKDRNVYLKNLRHTFDGNLIVSGWAYNDTITDWIYEGLLYKFSQGGDSIWMRDYYHYHNQYDINRFYDVSPTSDNGYIAIGKARPDQGGSTNKMWIMKVDSMGCDTPGCATGVQVFEFPVLSNEELKVWPNPAQDILNIEYRLTNHELGSEIIVYDLFGRKVKEIRVPKDKQTMAIDVSNWDKGMYFIKLVVDGEERGSTNVIVN